ncbi:MAG: PilW family protein [Gammaproteobacteria bacterium]|nr:PilW family protein [Gammaproteobacteria bacterium]MBU1415081.1 PilW family protein [Gammaproteobacteria bacterium]
MTGMRKHLGFSLIEILVGLVIGMIATVIIFQVFAVSERQKRATTGSADAQGNGAIGLFMLERDVRMAGWGLQQGSSQFDTCTNLFTYDVGTSGPLPNNGVSLLTAVSITDGGGGSDSIGIQYYDDPANETRFSSTVLSGNMLTGATNLTVVSTRGCCVEDGAGSCDASAPPMAAIIGSTDNCTLLSITSLNKATNTLTADPAAANQLHNPPVSYQTAHGWPAYSAGDADVQCFPGLYNLSYQINAEKLEVTEPDPATPGTTRTVEVAPGIVDLQAEYGVEDTTVSPPIQWVPATGAWATPTIANVRRIKAVRVSILARSGEYEKPDGATCDATTTTMADNWSSWATFNYAAYPVDWQCYRYKVFEAVIPLRNVIWANL